MAVMETYRLIHSWEGSGPLYQKKQKETVRRMRQTGGNEQLSLKSSRSKSDKSCEVKKGSGGGGWLRFGRPVRVAEAAGMFLFSLYLTPVRCSTVRSPVRFETLVSRGCTHA